jgi:hypothetical protein
MGIVNGLKGVVHSRMGILHGRAGVVMLQTGLLQCGPAALYYLTTFGRCRVNARRLLLRTWRKSQGDGWHKLYLQPCLQAARNRKPKSDSRCMIFIWCLYAYNWCQAYNYATLMRIYTYFVLVFVLWKDFLYHSISAYNKPSEPEIKILIKFLFPA